jgi:hypothetical protein
MSAAAEMALTKQANVVFLGRFVNNVSCIRIFEQKKSVSKQAVLPATHAV